MDSILPASASPLDAQAASAVDAIWEFVTSIREVEKRDGRIEDYALGKLENSIHAACAAAAQTDEFLRRSATERICDQLQKTYDGISRPNTRDIRRIVVEILNQHGLSSVAERYQAKRLEQDAQTVPADASLTHHMPTTHLTTGGESFSPRRRRLNDERKAVTHKFQVGKHEGYLTVGLYDDGQPGEIFLKMSKEGSVMSGLMDAFATAISIGLQYGVPLKVMVNKFAHMRFEPNGVTQNPNIPEARSIVDYIFRWLALKFLTPEERQSIGVHGTSEADPDLTLGEGAPPDPFQSRLLDHANGV